MVYKPIKEFVRGLEKAGKIKTSWVLPIQEILSTLTYQFSYKEGSDTGVHCTNVKTDKNQVRHVIFACSYDEWAKRTSLRRTALTEVFKKLEELQVLHTRSCVSHLQQHQNKKVLHCRMDREVLNYLALRIRYPRGGVVHDKGHPAFAGEPKDLHQRRLWLYEELREKRIDNDWVQLEKTVQALPQTEQDAFNKAYEEIAALLLGGTMEPKDYEAYIKGACILTGKEKVTTIDREEAVLRIMRRYLKSGNLPEYTKPITPALPP